MKARFFLGFLGMVVLMPPSMRALADEKPFGLTKRIPWNDSKVVGSPDPLPPYKVERVFPNLEIKQPLAIAPEPGTNRLFILQHLAHWTGPGRILVADDRPDISKTETLIDIDGLAVGFAFHPRYQENGYLYVGSNGPLASKKVRNTEVLRFTVDRKTGKVDPASKVTIIKWPSDGHDGGDLTFGNDGYLYVSSGDGSSDSDVNLTGQTLNDLLAAVIRIDVDHPENGKLYGVPKDNPFVDRKGACPELWAYGLRNPWRMSFDAPSGQLWVGQNGQDLWEQVYLIKKGGNYGWSIVEGSHVFQALRKPGPDPILPPTAEHHHSEFRSLTGGRVYRGKSLPELVGAYIYGDWSTGRVWGVKVENDKVVWNKELVDTPFNITGFGTDHSGELYVIDQVTGFYRFRPTTEADKPKQAFPTRLSQTGLFADAAAHRPNKAAIPYDVTTSQWADGASIDRFVAIPGLDKIEQKPQLNAGGSWTFPNGSVLVQTLSLNLADEAGKAHATRVETRIMTRQQKEWIGYSYRWNDEQTDAQLVPAKGTSEEFEVADASAPGGRKAQVWRFPSRTECLVCHSRAQGFVLGYTPLQLDRDHDYSGTVDNQLRTIEHIGLIEGKLPQSDESTKKRLVDPRDPHAPLEARVKSYLHVNCATCHVNEGGGNAELELGYPTPMSAMRLINENPQHNRFEIADPKVVAPGAPERSILMKRISTRATGQMPPLVSTEVDHQAMQMFEQWIKSLPAK